MSTRDRYSAKTSIPQIAAVFKPSTGIAWKSNTINLDLGGGRFDLGTQYLAKHGVTNLVFDPGNRSEDWNNRVLGMLDVEPADTVTISNVLNVIENASDRREVLRMADRYVRPGGHVYITVYEGDGKGVGRVTPKGWQENRRTADYLPEVRDVFEHVTRRGKLIVAR